MADLVRSERRGNVALLTLNRPDALNALDRSLLEALGEAIAGVHRDPSARALVLTGEGRAFAAGLPPRLEAVGGVHPLLFVRLSIAPVTASLACPRAESARISLPAR